MLVDKSTDLRYNDYNRGYIFFHKYKPKSGFCIFGRSEGINRIRICDEFSGRIDCRL